MIKGKFITFEGIDGSGKSTQISLVKRFLESKGKEVLVTREPGGGEVSEEIRRLILSNRLRTSTEILLFFAARVENYYSIIQPALDQGKWVLCDRFVDSTIAYQSGGKGEPKEHIEQLYDWTLNSCEPDKTFILDIPYQTSIDRIKNSRVLDHFEKKSSNFFNRVRDSYLEIAKVNSYRVTVIDGTLSKDEVFSSIVTKLPL